MPKQEVLMAIPQVALELGLRYHAARDLVLKGEISGGRYEGRNLVVPKEAVMAYKKKKEAK